MPGKIIRDPFMGFMFRLMCIFGILIVPWPGWNQYYGQYFRQVSQWTLNLEQEKRIVLLSPNPAQAAHPNVDTRMTLANRDLLDASGKGLLKRTGLDTRSIGWLPTALTMALILATPVPWRRRLLSLMGGLLLVQAFIVLTLLTWIWSHSSELSLMTLSPFWQKAADELCYALLDQLGASFSVPVIIWIVVIFRRQDLEALNNLKPRQRQFGEKSQTAATSSSEVGRLLRRSHRNITPAAAMAERYFPGGSGAARIPLS
jgi:hypothetical protein